MAITENVEAIRPLISDAQALLELSLNKLPVIGIGLAFFLVMFFLSRPIARLMIKPIGYVSKSDLIRVVTQRLVSFLIILLGLYVFLRLAGLTQFAFAVISGTGVAGLIIGFAFKDIAENFIASLLLSVQKPFKIGDVVEVVGNLGVINRVTSRATTLVDFDGNHIQIPNSIIYKNIIKNLSANPMMRSQFAVGIGYDSSIVEAQNVAMRLLSEQSAVLSDPAPQVLVDNLGSSTVNLMVYFWVDSEKNSTIKVSSLMQRLIKRGFEQANISMPDDARERIITITHCAEEDKDNSGKFSIQNAGKKVGKAAPLAPEVTTDDHSHDADIDSDVDDIKKQAKQSRSPEQGNNIL